MKRRIGIMLPTHADHPLPSGRLLATQRRIGGRSCPLSDSARSRKRALLAGSSSASLPHATCRCGIGDDPNPRGRRGSSAVLSDPARGEPLFPILRAESQLGHGSELRTAPKEGSGCVGVAAKVMLAHAIVTSPGGTRGRAAARPFLRASEPVCVVQCGSQAPTVALTASPLVPNLAAKPANAALLQLREHEGKSGRSSRRDGGRGSIEISGHWPPRRPTLLWHWSSYRG
jgi:hypothetical protein